MLQTWFKVNQWCMDAPILEIKAVLVQELVLLKDRLIRNVSCIQTVASVREKLKGCMDVHNNIFIIGCPSFSTVKTLSNSRMCLPWGICRWWNYDTFEKKSLNHCLDKVFQMVTCDPIYMPFHESKGNGICDICLVDAWIPVTTERGFRVAGYWILLRCFLSVLEQRQPRGIL